MTAYCDRIVHITGLAPCERSETSAAMSQKGVSTRLLIYAAQMIARGIAKVEDANVAICSPITDDGELQRSIREIVTTII